MVAAQFVGKMLPAFDQPGREIEPPVVVGGLDQQQNAARCQEQVYSLQCPVQGRGPRALRLPLQ